MSKRYLNKCQTCSNEEIYCNALPAICWVCESDNLIFCDLTVSSSTNSDHTQSVSSVSMSDDDAIAYNKQGFIQYKQGNFQNAIEAYNQAIRLNSHLAGAYSNRGESQYQQGNLEGAIADYNQAISLTPDNALAYLRRGIARCEQGDVEGAHQDYNQALNIDPDFFPNYLINIFQQAYFQIKQEFEDDQEQKTWICDGVPKDGEDYSPAGFEHEKHSTNVGEPCEICDLPEEAQQQRQQRLNLKGKPLVKVAVIAIGVIALTGGATTYFFAQKCPAGKDKVEGKCIDSQSIYEQVVNTGKQAITQADQFQSISDLKKARKLFQETINKLNQIPESSSVYTKAQEKINNYEQEIQKINEQVSKAKKNQQLLAETKELAQQAKQLTSQANNQETKIANKIRALKQARSKWKKAQEKLNKIPPNTIAFQRVDNKRQKYDTNISNIQNKINSLIARINSDDQNNSDQIDNNDQNNNNNDPCATPPKPESCAF